MQSGAAGGIRYDHIIPIPSAPKARVISILGYLAFAHLVGAPHIGFVVEAEKTRVPFVISP